MAGEQDMKSCQRICVIPHHLANNYGVIKKHALIENGNMPIAAKNLDFSARESGGSDEEMNMRMFQNLRTTDNIIRLTYWWELISSK